MKQLMFDYKENIEYQKVKDKVRAVILNNDGRALLVKYAGLYMLPGGKIDENETEKEALRREILEETGIDIFIDTDIENEEPFLQIETYNQNYYDRKADKKINRVRKTSFYALKTNQKIKIEKQRLSESEKQKNLIVEFENLSVIEYKVQNNKTDNFRKEIFDREILTALKEYCNYKECKEKEGQR